MCIIYIDRERDRVWFGCYRESERKKKERQASMVNSSDTVDRGSILSKDGVSW